VQRILVVDDDHAIRESIRLALDTGGMTVVTAESGERALEAFDAAFDGAIVDLMMSGMNGFETIRALRARAPELPIIIVSGSLVQAGPGAEDLLRMALGLAGVAILAKPFKVSELLRTARACFVDADPPVPKAQPAA
jgi:CheY-like chemotaxis protein